MNNTLIGVLGIVIPFSTVALSESSKPLFSYFKKNFTKNGKLGTVQDLIKVVIEMHNICMEKEKIEIEKIKAITPFLDSLIPELNLQSQSIEIINRKNKRYKIKQQILILSIETMKEMTHHLQSSMPNIISYLEKIIPNNKELLNGLNDWDFLTKEKDNKTPIKIQIKIQEYLITILKSILTVNGWRQLDKFKFSPKERHSLFMKTI